jgi:hypothetical protein
MFPEQLKKILNLIKKTGDRVVIFDGSNPTDSYVVMNFDNYAALRGDNNYQTELKSTERLSTVEDVNRTVNTPKIEKTENLTEEDLTDKINREISTWKNRDNSAYLGEEDKPKKAWQISSQVKDKAKEIEA